MLEIGSMAGEDDWRDRSEGTKETVALLLLLLLLLILLVPLLFTLEQPIPIAESACFIALAVMGVAEDRERIGENVCKKGEEERKPEEGGVKGD